MQSTNCTNCGSSKWTQATFSLNKEGIYLPISCSECLNKSMKDLSHKSEWISIKDKLPEKDKDILYVDNQNNIYLGQLASGMGQEIFWTHYDFLEDYDITHWMPLPEPPTILPEPTN